MNAEQTDIHPFAVVNDLRDFSLNPEVAQGVFENVFVS